MSKIKIKELSDQMSLEVKDILSKCKELSIIARTQSSSISFITELPKGLGLHGMIDYELQFEKSFVEPLKFITDKVLWRIDDSYGQQGTLEDFF